MPSILITLESGVSLAFIVIERMDSMLMHIRKQIREEVDELVPQQFRFISIWGPPISQVQEAKMAVRDALHDRKKLVVRNYDDKRNLKRKAEEFEESDKASEDGPTPPKASPQAKRPLQSTLTPPAKQPVQSMLTKLFSVPPNSLNTSEETTLSSCESASDHEQKTEEKEIVKKSAAFSSPSSKLDLFTDDEISNNPCWLERERRKHWNLKVHLSASKQCMTYDKVELLGIIDTDWTLKKAELLQIRVFELQVMHDSLETVYDRHPLPPPKTISDNQELVSKLLFCIKNEKQQINEHNLKNSQSSS